MITKKTKAQKLADKLFKSFVGEVYDARLRDDFKLRKDYQEDYTIDNDDKGVETLNETLGNA